MSSRATYTDEEKKQLLINLDIEGPKPSFQVYFYD